MGIRIHRSTWRAPLQLIDCWLPAPASSRPTRAGGWPLSDIAQRFVRAGWLGLSQPANDSHLHAHTRLTPCASTNPRPAPRQPVKTAVRRTDARIVLSGRLADVCEELDRLAALEPAAAVRPH